MPERGPDSLVKSQTNQTLPQLTSLSSLTSPMMQATPKVEVFKNDGLMLINNRNLTPQQVQITRDLSQKIPRIVKTPAKLRREIATLTTSKITNKHMENTMANNATRSMQKLEFRKSEPLLNQKSHKKLSLSKKLLVLGSTRNLEAEKTTTMTGLPLERALVNKTRSEVKLEGPSARSFMIPTKQKSALKNRGSQLERV